MIYALSIDWLAFYCVSKSGTIDESVDKYEYERAPHGTRQFKELVYCSLNKEQFAEVQQIPLSHILREGSIIVKFCNRFLYHVNLWHYVRDFMELHQLTILNVSRVDLCADFNMFYHGLNPVSLISGFLSSQYRHIGRGNGSAFFNHFSRKEGKVSKSHLNYTGLKFGSKQSAANVYLYNKTYELLTVKDKPHIRKLWAKVGLINTLQESVWRLEVSITSKGMKFTDKSTREGYQIDSKKLQSNSDISLIYHTFIKSLFSFIKNREGITNVSREPRVQLFSGAPYIERTLTSEGDAGNRAEKILIKQLWQMCDRYRGSEIIADEGIAKALSYELAKSCDLLEWFGKKNKEWSKPKRN